MLRRNHFRRNSATPESGERFHNLKQKQKAKQNPQTYKPILKELANRFKPYNVDCGQAHNPVAETSIKGCFQGELMWQRNIGTHRAWRQGHHT